LGIATALAQVGVKVMLCDIEEAALAKAIADLKLTNADVDGARADVSLKAELQAAADATVARYGKIPHSRSTMRGLAVAWATADGPMQVGIGHSVLI
jgi:Enoyl-(Acyl carrier protein) reductase